MKLLDNLIHERVEISHFLGSADCGFILKKNFEKDRTRSLKVKKSNMKTRMFDELKNPIIAEIQNSQLLLPLYSRACLKRR
ncbi:MAG: hypothetical protein ACFFD2_08865 [Promethearchaeota archaeon]